jgi:hypothetical protein
MKELKDLKGFWIRKNKNVQVRCLVNFNTDEERRILVCFRNGHQKYMSKEQLLSEFINLDDFLARVSKGTKWVDRKSAYLKQEAQSFVVCEVCLRKGVVIYQPKSTAPSGKYQTTIGHFDTKFQPEKGEE